MNMTANSKTYSLSMHDEMANLRTKISIKTEIYQIIGLEEYWKQEPKQKNKMKVLLFLLIDIQFNYIYF